MTNANQLLRLGFTTMKTFNRDSCRLAEFPKPNPGIIRILPRDAGVALLRNRPLVS